MPTPEINASIHGEEPVIADQTSPASNIENDSPHSSANGSCRHREKTTYAATIGYLSVEDPIQWKKIFRHRWLFTIIFLVVTVPSLVLLWTQVSPIYLAVGKIRVRPMVPRLVFQTDDNGFIPYFDSYANTQTDIIRSPVVLQPVLDNPAVQASQWYQTLHDRLGEVSPDLLAGELDVQFKPKTEIVQVAMSGKAPNDLAVIVNTILEQYIKYLQESADRNRDRIYRKLADQYQSLLNEIKEQQKVVGELRKKIGTASPDQLISQKRMRLDDLDFQLRNVNQEIEMSQWQWTRFRSTSKRLAEPSEKSEEPADEISDLPRKIQILKHRRDLLSEDLNQQTREFDELFRQAQALTEKNEALAHKVELAGAMRTRLEQKDLERNVPGSVEILARALPPVRPMLDRRKKLSSAVILAGLMAGFGAAFLRARTSRILYEPEEIHQWVDQPFLGQLPIMPPPRSQTPQHRALQGECVRMLRTALLKRLDCETGCVLAVTSAALGAGKTTVAILVAQSLAQSGKKVLLVDADLRKPAVALRLGLSDSPAIRRVSTDEANTDLILKTANPCLDVLPAHQNRCGEFFELLDRGGLVEKLERWRRAYQIVILDTPPLLPVADAGILAQTADETLLVVRERHSRMEDIAEALDQLETCGAKLLGLVYIGNHRFKNRYGYYGGYLNSSAKTKNIAVGRSA